MHHSTSLARPVSVVVCKEVTGDTNLTQAGKATRILIRDISSIRIGGIASQRIIGVIVNTSQGANTKDIWAGSASTIIECFSLIFGTFFFLPGR